MSLTEDQIFALAPDASSIKSGKELASLSKWQIRGSSDKALWGHCQGSGKLPYQTQIDLQNLAFKCSCPSRKFPCKHGLGLLLLYSRESKSFSHGQEPDWVEEWLNKRTEKITKKTDPETKPVDSEAQSKRAESRAKKVRGGIEDLQIWLKDLIRNGLISLPERSYEFWQNPSKRMIDAQATGLASMIKALGNINYFNDSWKYEVLNQLTRIHLLSESYKQLETLPEDFQQEIKTLIGFTQSKEELNVQDGVKDQWIVMARTLEDDEQLTIERNWLYGVNTKRIALILQFFVNRQLPALSLLPGTSIQAELVFYLGVQPYRAIIKQHESTEKILKPDFHESVSIAVNEFSKKIIENPFYTQIPILLGNTRFIKRNKLNYLSDSSGDSITVTTSDRIALNILAITGGKPSQFFLLVNENGAEPLAVWTENNFISLTHAIQK